MIYWTYFIIIIIFGVGCIYELCTVSFFSSFVVIAAFTEVITCSLPPFKLGLDSFLGERLKKTKKN